MAVEALWRFANKPQGVKLMGIDFCTEDGKKLYPRILSKYIDEKIYLTVKTLELQVLFFCSGMLILIHHL